MKNGGLFITGTDTGVGKTVVTAHLGQFLQREGYDITVVKPFQTGLSEEEGDFKIYAKYLSGLGDVALHVPVRLQYPQAPSIAAALEKKRIRLDAVKRSLYILTKSHKNVLLEGAGGVMVPVTSRTTMLDFMKMVGLSVLVVARPDLGTINHTVLTVQAIERAGLQVAAIVFSFRKPEKDGCFSSVKKEIRRLTGCSRLLELPFVTGTEIKWDALRSFFRK